MQMEFSLGVPPGGGDGAVSAKPAAWRGALPLGATVTGHGYPSPAGGSRHQCIATAWAVTLPADKTFAASEGPAITAYLTQALAGMTFPDGHPACNPEVSTRLGDNGATILVVMVGMTVERYCELSPNPCAGVTWASYSNGAPEGTMDWFVFE